MAVLGKRQSSIDDLVGEPKTKDYRPSYGGMPAWVHSPNYMVFHLGAVDHMHMDSTVALGTAMIETPVIRQEGQWQILADDPRIQFFVDSTLRKFWKRPIRPSLSCVRYGHSGGEVLYRRDKEGYLHLRGLKPLHQYDIVPGIDRRTGQYGGVVVQGGGSHQELRAAERSKPASGLWIYYGSEFNNYFGESRYQSAFMPWREKNGTDGAKDIIRMWYYKNAYSGLVIRHPEEDVKVNGQYIPARNMARQIAEVLKTGGVAAIPSTINPRTNRPKWEVEWPHINGNPEGLLEYLSHLDQEIFRGLRIPDDVITGASGAYSGKKVSEDAFYTMEEDLLHAIAVPVDEQIISPLVEYNFGPGDKYEIRWPPMLPARQQMESQQAIGAAAPGGGNPAAAGVSQSPIADLLLGAGKGEEPRPEQFGLSLGRIRLAQEDESQTPSTPEPKSEPKSVARPAYQVVKIGKKFASFKPDGRGLRGIDVHDTEAEAHRAAREHLGLPLGEYENVAPSQDNPVALPVPKVESRDSPPPVRSGGPTLQDLMDRWKDWKPTPDNRTPSVHPDVIDAEMHPDIHDLAAVLAGSKPLALVDRGGYEALPDSLRAEIIQEAKRQGKAILHDPLTKTIALGDKESAKGTLGLIRDSHANWDNWDARARGDYHRKLGEALGYPEESIKKFVNKSLAQNPTMYAEQHFPADDEKDGPDFPGSQTQGQPIAEDENELKKLTRTPEGRKSVETHLPKVLDREEIYRMQGAAAKLAQGKQLNPAEKEDLARIREKVLTKLVKTRSADTIPGMQAEPTEKTAIVPEGTPVEGEPTVLDQSAQPVAPEDQATVLDPNATKVTPQDTDPNKTVVVPPGAGQPSAKKLNDPDRIIPLKVKTQRAAPLPGDGQKTVVKTPKQDAPPKPRGKYDDRIDELFSKEKRDENEQGELAGMLGLPNGIIAHHRRGDDNGALVVRDADGLDFLATRGSDGKWTFEDGNNTYTEDDFQHARIKPESWKPPFLEPANTDEILEKHYNQDVDGMKLKDRVVADMNSGMSDEHMGKRIGYVLSQDMRKRMVKLQKAYLEGTATDEEKDQLAKDIHTAGKVFAAQQRAEDLVKIGVNATREEKEQAKQIVKNGKNVIEKMFGDMHDLDKAVLMIGAALLFDGFMRRGRGMGGNAFLLGMGGLFYWLMRKHLINMADGTSGASEESGQSSKPSKSSPGPDPKDVDYSDLFKNIVGLGDAPAPQPGSASKTTTSLPGQDWKNQPPPVRSKESNTGLSPDWFDFDAQNQDAQPQQGPQQSALPKTELEDPAVRKAAAEKLNPKTNLEDDLGVDWLKDLNFDSLKDN